MLNSIKHPHRKPAYDKMAKAKRRVLALKNPGWDRPGVGSMCDALAECTR